MNGNMTTLFYFKTHVDYWDPPETYYYKAYIDDDCDKDSCKLVYFSNINKRITISYSDLLNPKSDINRTLKSKNVTIISEKEWKENVSKMLEIAKNLI